MKSVLLSIQNFKPVWPYCCSMLLVWIQRRRNKKSSFYNLSWVHPVSEWLGENYIIVFISFTHLEQIFMHCQTSEMGYLQKKINHVNEWIWHVSVLLSFFCFSVILRLTLPLLSEGIFSQSRNWDQLPLWIHSHRMDDAISVRQMRSKKQFINQ